MSNESVETGWKRFLERLKQLWGRSRGSDVPAGAVTTSIAATSATPASGESPAPNPGSP